MPEERNYPYLDVPPRLRHQMVELARQFRKESTPTEAILWQALRGRKLEGIKFRREQPIGPFVVDFFAASERLIVEVDGPIHESQVEADARRQRLLEELGLRFVRIKSEVVERNLATALEMIRAGILRTGRAIWEGPSLPSPPRPPSPKEGEGGGGPAEPRALGMDPAAACSPSPALGEGAGE